jgi:hypothetical protein
MQESSGGSQGLCAKSTLSLPLSTCTGPPVISPRKSPACQTSLPCCSLWLPEGNVFRRRGTWPCSLPTSVCGACLLMDQWHLWEWGERRLAGRTALASVVWMLSGEFMEKHLSGKEQDNWVQKENVVTVRLSKTNSLPCFISVGGSRKN